MPRPQTTTTEPRTRRHHRALGPIVTTLLAGVLLTGVACRLTADAEQRRLDAEFSRTVAPRATSVRNAIENHIVTLNAIKALFKASRRVERSEFAAFTRPLLSLHGGIRSLEWIPRVRGEERFAWERDAGSNGLPAFRISEFNEAGDLDDAAPRAEHFPVYYVEPLAGNEQHVGVDLAAERHRLGVLQLSRYVGRTVASGRLDDHLVTGDQCGFMVIVPQFARDAPIDEAEQRVEHHEGFILGVFDAGTILTQASASPDTTDIRFELIDETAPPIDSLLASVPDRSDFVTPAGAPEFRYRFRLADRDWAVVAVAGAGWMEANASSLAWIVPTIGLLFTALAAACVGLVSGRTARIERDVEVRTWELTRQARRMHLLSLEREQDKMRLKRTIDLLHAMTGAQSQFIASANPRRVFDSLITSILTVTDSTYGFIGEVRTDDKTKQMVLRTHAVADASHPDQPVRRGEAMRSLGSIPGRVITANEPMILNEPLETPGDAGLPSDHPAVESFLGLPFADGSTVLGIVGVANRRGGYDESVIDHLQPLLAMCTNIVTAHRNDRRRREVETAIKLINDRLLRANETLEERNREVLQLAYAITHDLQTPLATLTGSVEALAHRLPEANEDQLRWMERIKQSSARMVEMLNQLMVYAKAGSAQALAPVSVPVQVQAALDVLAPQATEKGIVIDARVEPCAVMANESFLLRAIMNVIGNSVKFLDADAGGHVDIEVARVDDRVRITVHDNGPGIDPMRLDEVFEPFKRASTRRDGTGLGLATVRKYVNTLGGQVRLVSDGQSGTTAVLEIPATDEVPAAKAEAA